MEQQKNLIILCSKRMLFEETELLSRTNFHARHEAHGLLSISQMFDCLGSSGFERGIVYDIRLRV